MYIHVGSHSAGHLNPLTLIHKQTHAMILQAKAVATTIPVNLAVSKSFHPNKASLLVSIDPPPAENGGYSCSPLCATHEPD